MRIVYAPGVWDLLHIGHLNLLQRAKALGDVLVVGVVSDDGTAAYKRRPVQDQETRLAVVQALRNVDFALIQATTDPTPEILALQPAVLCHGDDWQRLLKGQDTLDQLGIEFVLLPYTPGISSTILVERVRHAE